MKKFVCLTVLLFSGAVLMAQELMSPDGKFRMQFSLDVNGAPNYRLDYKGKAVIKPSKLGIELKDKNSFLNGFSIKNSESNPFDETWQPVFLMKPGNRFGANGKT